MTTSTKVPAVPPEFENVHREFEQWRRTRQVGTRIPASLWSAAAATARRCGVSRTARALHLEERKLRRLTDAATPARHPTVPPAFVELLASESVNGSGECSIEVESPRGGRVKITLRGMPLPDLVALSRIVWGPEA